MTIMKTTIFSPATILAAMIMAAPHASFADGFFREGFQIDAVARSFCQIDDQTDQALLSDLVQKRGFQTAQDSMSFEHPEGLTLTWMPAMARTPGVPTCRMTASSDLMTDVLFTEYLGAVVQTVPEFDLGQPEDSEAGTVWSFHSKPDRITEKIWATELTRLSTGGIIVNRWPVTK